MGAHFAQIIRDGGPLWMFGVDTGGTVSAAVHRGSGGTGAILKLEAMKWYDFRVDTEYRGGGSIKFYVNGKLVGQGRGDGGADGALRLRHLLDAQREAHAHRLPQQRQHRRDRGRGAVAGRSTVLIC